MQVIGPPRRRAQMLAETASDSATEDPFLEVPVGNFREGRSPGQRQKM